MNQITTMNANSGKLTKQVVVATALACLFWAAPPALHAQESSNAPARPGFLPRAILFETKSSSFSGFLDALKKAFGYDLSEHADIPRENMDSARVPALRIRTQNVWDVLNLYNSVSENYGGMGKWFVKWEHLPGPDPKMDSTPAAIFLVPPQTNVEPAISVRAFSVRKLSAKAQKLLVETIEIEQARLEAEVRSGTFGPQQQFAVRGRIRLHENTAILVATGGKTYVELVETLINAVRESDESN